ncbi:Hint domain-containing protein [Seohaeicola saemankumensis]|nr:Hint domain-containing protein [Seohaeicola saemankumensis]MCA0870547.1 Hint domain-containing protein [Seohaeicola saemankumensis]
MTNITLTAQDVNGDPYVTGGGINIVNNSTTVLTFVDVDHQLNDPLTGEYVSMDGGLTLLSYQYIGNGDVRGDPMQNASFIRIDMGDGTYLTVALDMNADFDDLPDLQNGNTQLTPATLDSTSPNWFPGFACFCMGTLIDTEDGPRPVEDLRPGDRIVTADRGLQPLVHLAQSTVPAIGALAPVVVLEGAMGNTRDLWVSQQHRMLIQGWRAQLFCGEDEVFVPAIKLVNGRDIRVMPGGRVTYYHLLFVEHEVVFSEGIPTESYFPGAQLGSDASAARAEAMALFPDLAGAPASGGQTARHVARGPVAQILRAA